ncbi:hypothetical protein M5E86_12800 [Blautia wexlerae]|nr:hypothetical protein M5E86_12800 [Blautia wexlerae]
MRRRGKTFLSLFLSAVIVTGQPVLAYRFFCWRGNIYFGNHRAGRRCIGSFSYFRGYCGFRQ